MREVEWQRSRDLMPYPFAVAAMEDRVERIRRGEAPELIWLLEHPPLYTAGTSAREADLTLPAALPVHRTGRGGQFTYHGPGQRVVYVMLDLRRQSRAGGPDLRAYVRALEEWLIRTLSRLGVTGERREGRVGIWVEAPGRGEAKIAALGVRIRHWIAFHGIALNVAPDLAHYAGIVPCGVRNHGVTSLAALGLAAEMDAIDTVLLATFAEVFDIRPRPVGAPISSPFPAPAVPPAAAP